VFGDPFVEMDCPVRTGTPAGRLLERRGDASLARQRAVGAHATSQSNNKCERTLTVMSLSHNE